MYVLTLLFELLLLSKTIIFQRFFNVILSVHDNFNRSFVQAIESSTMKVIIPYVNRILDLAVICLIHLVLSMIIR